MKFECDFMSKRMTTDLTLAFKGVGFAINVNWLLAAAVTCTFINGLIISFFVLPAVSGAVGLSHYADGWDLVAQNIVQGNGFVSNPAEASTLITGYLKREPIYPLFLALILAVFGQLNPYVVIFQALINSLTCLVLFFIVRKIFDRRVALLACFLYAFYPFASWYVSRVAYETLLGLFVALLLLGLLNLFERLSFRRALIVGLLLGVTVLCRGLYLLFPFALLVGLIVHFGTKDSRVIGCWATVVVTMLLIVSPWMLRNYLITQQFVPMTTVGGINYFYGNKIIKYYSLRANTAGHLPDQESARMYNEMRDTISRQNPELSNPQVEVKVDKTFIGMAVEDMVTHPLTFVEKVMKGLAFVWFLNDTGIKSTALLLMQGPLLLFGVIGMFCGLKAKKQVLPPLMILIYFVGIQTAIISYGRYSYPMVAILIAFAAYSLQMFRDKISTWCTG